MIKLWNIEVCNFVQLWALGKLPSSYIHYSLYNMRCIDVFYAHSASFATQNKFRWTALKATVYDNQIGHVMRKSASDRAQNAYSDHSAHAPSIIRALALQSYIP